VPAPFAFDRTFAFGVSAADLWKVLSRVDDYPRWWSWLTTFDADGLHAGAVARCVVRPPLPYSLRFSVHVEEATPARLVAARVSGDLDGRASLELTDTTSGCRARLHWTVQLRPAPLQAAALVARPLMVWGHEWVVRVGVRQFEQNALNNFRGD
jgi:uncharacterized protein YndB with AHSA1/START domain